MMIDLNDCIRCDSKRYRERGGCASCACSTLKASSRLDEANLLRRFHSAKRAWRNRRSPINRLTGLPFFTSGRLEPGRIIDNEEKTPGAARSPGHTSAATRKTYTKTTQNAVTTLEERVRTPHFQVDALLARIEARFCPVLQQAGRTRASRSNCMVDTIKVSAKSRSTAVAGAIAGVMREHKHAEVQAIARVP